jgi:hypothetical protein
MVVSSCFHIILALLSSNDLNESVQQIIIFTQHFDIIISTTMPSLLALVSAPLLVLGQYNKRYFPGRQTADILSLVQVDAVVTNEQVLAAQKLKNSNDQLRKRLKLLSGKEEDGGSTELALLQQELAKLTQKVESLEQGKKSDELHLLHVGEIVTTSQD